MLLKKHNDHNLGLVVGEKFIPEYLGSEPAAVNLESVSLYTIQSPLLFCSSQNMGPISLLCEHQVKGSKVYDTHCP